MKHKYRGVIVGGSIALVVGLVFYGFCGYVTINHQRVQDQLKVWKFAPTVSITEQIKRTGMSSEGAFLYLASEPSIESKVDFNTACSAVTTDTSILGCYIKRTQRSVIYRETDRRLDGTEEVWAAHEMLRAAWDRMTAAQRADLKAPLHKILFGSTDENIDLAGRMANINRDDPNDAQGELYAIVGTEVPDAGAGLERSYANYFTDRTTVTQLAAHARSHLVALKLQVDTLSDTITTLGTTIDKRAKAFNKSVHKLVSAIKVFNSRAETPGGFATEGQFTVARAALIGRQHALKSTAKNINRQIDDFNADLKKLSGLSKTAASLIKSLNVDLTPLPNLSKA